MTRIIVTVGYQQYLLENANDASDVISAMSRATPVEYSSKNGGGYAVKDEVPNVGIEFTTEERIEWPKPRQPEKTQAIDGDVLAPVVEVPF